MNMVFLLAFGAAPSRRMGAENALKSFSAFASACMFLTFYLLCGAAGALLFILMHADQVTLLVGASGGVSGLLGALVRFAFNRTTILGPEYARFSPLFSPHVLGLSALIIAMNIVFGVGGAPFSGGASIAWEAHIGGFFAGLFLVGFFVSEQPAPPDRQD